MLTRVLEPEIMDSPDEAADYDSMDHSVVNERFVEDLLAVRSEPGDILDLGTGTAQIPVALCRRHPSCRILAADAAVAMLELARYNVEAAGQIERIQLAHVDAKELPFADGLFDTVMSNSIVHHIPEPAAVLAEAVRVTAPGGMLFFRDLLRPDSEERLAELVATYAGDCNEHQRKMFSDSLRAALSLDELRELVAGFVGLDNSVAQTSDRHWTWVATKR
jgi:ubiquinone/menaquinone biosynthesis C-methylase UbiE